MVHTKRLSEILNIFPVKYIGDNIERENDENCLNNFDNLTKDKQNERKNSDNTMNIPIKNSDYEYFTQYLKTAIDLDRSERLSEMIKTTGYQLYNTFVGSNAENLNKNQCEN